MKELIYIHASTSYLASHFFNAQQSYLEGKTANNDNKEESAVDPDISFTQVVADGLPTLCPRLLLFDYKNKFGSVAHINALHTDGEDEYDQLIDSTWTGPIAEHRQDPIPQSSYHAKLDIGEADDSHDLKTNDPKEKNGDHEGPHDLTPSIRFWSDFSRVYHHPRGLHRVPDPAEWERGVGWRQGVERFTAYDVEHAVLEDAFRLFAEECDLLQGVQVSLDASSFGSFTTSFLSELRDEYSKLPILSFCSLSPYEPSHVNLDNTGACVGALNDVITLHELASLSTITVPLQSSSTWRHGLWSTHLHANFANTYHSSAILAAHIENATLPLRLNASHPSTVDLATLCAHLNWRGDTPFASLFGSFPMPSSPLDLDPYDYSHPALLHKEKQKLSFAQRDVFRGLTPQEGKVVQEWVGETQSELREPLLSTSYIPTPYPIPSSHPQFFNDLDSTGRHDLSSNKTHVHVRSIPIYTSLRTTPRTGYLAVSYARLTEGVLRGRPGVLEELGIERETVGEVLEECWKWGGAYDVGEADEAERGEDEGDSA